LIKARKKAATQRDHVTCRAKRTADPPQDCDWPHCGCDPLVDRVLAALQEEGWMSLKEFAHATAGAEPYDAEQVNLGLRFQLAEAHKKLRAATEEIELREQTDPSSSLLSPGEGLVKELLAQADRHTACGKDCADARLLRSAAQALQAATERAEQAEAEIAEAKAALTEGPHGLLLTTGLGPSIRMWLSATNATRIALIERAEQAERDRDCYLKNLEDAQGDIAAEVVENNRLRDQLQASEHLRVEALELVETLQDYAQHHADCPRAWVRGSHDPFPDKPCSCGLASLLTRPPK
jgi:sulfur relay (sulfurtransferase) DsrC/TusE family protein